jgi:hypothetical protein
MLDFIKTEPIKIEYLQEELPPFILLTFDLLMILDLITNGSISFIFASQALWALLAFIITTFLLRSIYIVFIYAPVVLGYMKVFNKMHPGKKTTPVDDRNKSISSIISFCVNMIIPSVLFGIFFPLYINQSILQPYFTIIFSVLAVLLFLAGYYAYFGWCFSTEHKK